VVALDQERPVQEGVPGAEEKVGESDGQLAHEGVVEGIPEVQQTGHVVSTDENVLVVQVPVNEASGQLLKEWRGSSPEAERLVEDSTT
jgi:hypothetical protein